MSDKLKPCPFCGNHLVERHNGWFDHPKGKCILSGKAFPKGHIGQWNIRAIPTPTDADLDAAALARPVVVALVEAADRMLAVIVDAMEYRHSGDPWEENAMSMREMDIHYYYDSPQLELDRATLSAAKGATHADR